MTRVRLLLLSIVVTLLPCCIDPPKVVQGTVTSYDHASKMLVLTDELPPGGQIRISLAGAEVGAEPAVGDKVRLAYRERDGQRTALRLANISRQAEIGGQGSGKKK